MESESMNKLSAKLQKHLLQRLPLSFPKFFASRQEKSFLGKNF